MAQMIGREIQLDNKVYTVTGINYRLEYYYVTEKGRNFKTIIAF